MTESTGSVNKPPIQYAKSGDEHIAYQVIGDAGVGLVFLPEVSGSVAG